MTIQAGKQKKGVLLINLGTPDSPSVKDVRKYLREFLMDERVIDIPYLSRFFLVNTIIAPFRAYASAKIYQELWTEEGSPLKTSGYKLRTILSEALGSEYQVFFAMRYQNPSLESVIKDLQKTNVSQLTIIPLYPQYASSSTGSSIEEALKQFNKYQVIPSLNIISQFFDHPNLIKAFADRARQHMQHKQYDHFLFSYHGIPQRHIHKSSVDGYCQINEKCCASYHSKNKYCYRAQCFATTRLLVKELGIQEGQYTVSFQSRLGKDPWIKPYSDEVIANFPKQGIKSVLAFSPAFVADCLETTIEVGVEYRDLFLENGGEHWDLVESLNEHPLWVECLKDLILCSSKSNSPVEKAQENYA